MNSTVLKDGGNCTAHKEIIGNCPTFPDNCNPTAKSLSDSDSLIQNFQLLKIASEGQVVNTAGKTKSDEKSSNDSTDSLRKKNKKFLKGFDEQETKSAIRGDSSPTETTIPKLIGIKAVVKAMSTSAREGSAFRSVNGPSSCYGSGALQIRNQKLKVDYRSAWTLPDFPNYKEEHFVQCSHSDKRSKTDESCPEQRNRLDVYTNAKITGDGKLYQSCESVDTGTKKPNLQNLETIKNREYSKDNAEQDKNSLTTATEQSNPVNVRILHGNSSYGELCSGLNGRSISCENNLIIDLNDKEKVDVEKQIATDQCSHSDFSLGNSSNLIMEDSSESELGIRISEVFSLKDKSQSVGIGFENICSHSDSSLDDKSEVVSKRREAIESNKDWNRDRKLCSSPLAAKVGSDRQRTNHNNETQSEKSNDSEGASELTDLKIRPEETAIKTSEAEPKAKRHRDSKQSTPKSNDKDNAKKIATMVKKNTSERIAFDLPGHNWLIERLLKENKLGIENVEEVGSETLGDERENFVKGNTSKVTEKHSSVKDTKKSLDRCRKRSIQENEDEEKSSKLCSNSDIENSLKAGGISDERVPEKIRRASSSSEWQETEIMPILSSDVQEEMGVSDEMKQKDKLREINVSRWSQVESLFVLEESQQTSKISDLSASRSQDEISESNGTQERDNSVSNLMDKDGNSATNNNTKCNEVKDVSSGEEQRPSKLLKSPLLNTDSDFTNSMSPVSSSDKNGNLASSKNGSWIKTETFVSGVEQQFRKLLKPSLLDTNSKSVYVGSTVSNQSAASASREEQLSGNLLTTSFLDKTETSSWLNGASWTKSRTFDELVLSGRNHSQLAKISWQGENDNQANKAFQNEINQAKTDESHFPQEFRTEDFSRIGKTAHSEEKVVESMPHAALISNGIFKEDVRPATPLKCSSIPPLVKDLNEEKFDKISSKLISPPIRINIKSEKEVLLNVDMKSDITCRLHRENGVSTTTKVIETVSQPDVKTSQNVQRSCSNMLSSNRASAPQSVSSSSGNIIHKLRCSSVDNIHKRKHSDHLLGVHNNWVNMSTAERMPQKKEIIPDSNIVNHSHAHQNVKTSPEEIKRQSSLHYHYHDHFIYQPHSRAHFIDTVGHAPTKVSPLHASTCMARKSRHDSGDTNEQRIRMQQMVNQQMANLSPFPSPGKSTPTNQLNHITSQRLCPNSQSVADKQRNLEVFHTSHVPEKQQQHDMFPNGHNRHGQLPTGCKQLEVSPTGLPQNHYYRGLHQKCHNTVGQHAVPALTGNRFPNASAPLTEEARKLMVEALEIKRKATMREVILKQQQEELRILQLQKSQTTDFKLFKLLTERELLLKASISNLLNQAESEQASFIQTLQNRSLDRGTDVSVGPSREKYRRHNFEPQRVPQDISDMPILTSQHRDNSGIVNIPKFGIHQRQPPTLTEGDVRSRTSAQMQAYAHRNINALEKHHVLDNQLFQGLSYRGHNPLDMNIDSQTMQTLGNPRHRITHLPLNAQCGSISTTNDIKHIQYHANNNKGMIDMVRKPPSLSFKENAQKNFQHKFWCEEKPERVSDVHLMQQHSVHLDMQQNSLTSAPTQNQMALSSPNRVSISTNCFFWQTKFKFNSDYNFTLFSLWSATGPEILPFLPRLVLRAA